MAEKEETTCEALTIYKRDPSDGFWYDKKGNRYVLPDDGKLQLRAVKGRSK